MTRRQDELTLRAKLVHIAYDEAGVEMASAILGEMSEWQSVHDTLPGWLSAEILAYDLGAIQERKG